MSILEGALVKKCVLATWQRITLARHKSELRALQWAQSIGWLAPLPIFATVGFWWIAFSSPMILIYLVGFPLKASASPLSRFFGYFLLVPLNLALLYVVFAAAPWFFRWYFIAAGLMFGRTTMADQKEA